MAPGDLRDLRDLHDILTVTIDGVPVPALDGAIVNRTYDPQTNSIVFSGSS